MEQMSDLSPSEQAAYKQGFLFGFNTGEFLYENELEVKNPYTKGTIEYDRWKEGFYSNL
jgi:hypothetical protein